MIRAFCVNYEPVRLTLSAALVNSLMESADACILAPHGVPIGAKIDALGKRYRCVAHEHHGKIVVLEADTL